MSAQEPIPEKKLDISAFMPVFHDLARRYVTHPATRDGLIRDADALAERADDPRLYLGVVGEFSSGKTTFINALIGFNLLKEDVLQGTTCAPTLLRPAESFDVHIHRADGGLLRYAGFWLRLWQRIPLIRPGPHRLMRRAIDFIHRHTAEEAEAREVDRIIIDLPLKTGMLRDGVVIVDTPGVNANDRHDQVTQRALERHCDAALVVTSAEAPCSTTLLDFVRAHLEGIQSHCVAVLTKIDKVRDRTPEKTRKAQERQIQFARGRFERDTGQPFAHTLAVAARHVLPDAAPPADDAEREEQIHYQRQFTEAENLVREHLAQSRDRIAATKLALMIESVLLPPLSASIKKKGRELTRRHRELEDNKLRDLDGFLDEHKQRHVEALKVVARECVTAQTAFLREWQEDVQRAVRDAIDKAADKDALKKNVAADALQSLCARFAERIDRERGGWRRPVEECARDAVRQVDEAFSEAYRRLAVLTHAADGDSLSGMPASDQSILHTGIAGQATGISTFADDAKALGGGAAGAAIGTMILPGLGTVIGGFLGWGFGKLFGKSLDEYKKEAREKCLPVVDEWAEKVRAGLTEQAKEHNKACGTLLAQRIGGYRRYRDKVNRMIEQETKTQAALQDGLRVAREDLKKLLAIHDRVQQSREALTTAPNP